MERKKLTYCFVSCTRLMTTTYHACITSWLDAPRHHLSVWSFSEMLTGALLHWASQHPAGYPPHKQHSPYEHGALKGITTTTSVTDKCLVSNEVTEDMDKRNKFLNGVAGEVASIPPG
jgi:hypothetical protein